MRAVASGDYDKALQVMRWPVIELLHAYTRLQKERALADYRQSLLLWAQTVSIRKDKRAPTRPAILED